MKSIFIFGGTFDPIHKAHINIAKTVQDDFKAERFIFLPCKIPTLKDQAKASSSERLHMLQLSLAEYPHYPFEIDLREIKRDTPSYTLITLNDYRKEYAKKDYALTFLLGEDSFLSLPLWENFEALLDLANLLVLKRAGVVADMPDSLKSLLARSETKEKEVLSKTAHGLIYQYNAGLYPLSSTLIREQIKNNKDTSLLLPQSVENYIKTKGLYL